MPRASDVIRFLEKHSLATRVVSGPFADLDLEIAGARNDHEARSGEIAWLSPRASRSNPERIAAFGGSILVCEPTNAIPAATATLVFSDEPKRAFTQALEHFFGHLATVQWPAGPAAVHESAIVSKTAILAAGVVLGPMTDVGDGVRVGPNTCIAYTTIGPNVTIGSGCAIGLAGFGYERDAAGKWHRFPHLGRVVIEGDVEIGSNTCIDRGSLGETRVCTGAKIDNLVHIAHNVVVGAGALVIADAMIGGSVQIGERAWVSPSVAIMNQLSVGADAIVGMGATVIRDVAEGATVVGNPAKPLIKHAQ